MTRASRRTFLKVGASLAGAAAMASLPRPLLATVGSRPEPVPPIEDPRLEALASRALDAARSQGAAYADVRLTHTRERGFSPAITELESLEVGVRVLVDGCWGLASGPIWSPDEMARLGREAVHQARANAFGQRRRVELAPVPVVEGGHWVMPVERDPFTVSPFEIQDFLESLATYTNYLPPRTSTAHHSARFTMQDKAFASTDGSFCTQRLHRAAGGFTFKVKLRDGQIGMGTLDCLTPAGLGWELFTAARVAGVREEPLREVIRRTLEELKADMALPTKPVEIGRYDTAMDALSVARLVDATLGRATELDRALGYEANASGTSYLDDPSAMVGRHQMGAPALVLHADRGDQGGAATVRWDDEGVEPHSFTLVRDGVLTDFQTTRESACWLGDYYAKIGEPVRSHGCASAPSAVAAPLQHRPNLTLEPGSGSRGFDALVSDLDHGIALKSAAVDMDFQQLNGLGTGRMFEVKRGKRVARLVGASFLFRAPELWKGLIAVGGANSARRYGFGDQKGEPAQTCYHSVNAPAAGFQQLTVIDPRRKA